MITTEPIDDPAEAPPPRSAGVRLDQSQFLYKLTVATFCLVLVVIALYLLREFRQILQPLFIAVFLCYVILPVHRWLVVRRVPSKLAYVLILLLTLAALFGLGALLYQNVAEFLAGLPQYEERFEKTIRQVGRVLHWELPEGSLLSDLSFLRFDLLGTLGTFGDFFTDLAITFVYLVFLFAEMVSFRGRVLLAFGERQGERVLEVVGSINQAISEYLSVKTFISFVAGLFSMAVLAVFRVDFFITLGILIFLLNFIPYIGSLVAVAPAIALSFLKLDLWAAIVVTLLLIGVQQACAIMEPRLAGRKLGVSPLLILLSLAFWGVVWGIVGMILAVPLLMTLKIILDNIKETKAVATLMSNQ